LTKHIRRPEYQTALLKIKILFKVPARTGEFSVPQEAIIVYTVVSASADILRESLGIHLILDRLPDISVRNSGSLKAKRFKYALLLSSLIYCSKIILIIPFRTTDFKLDRCTVG